MDIRFKYLFILVFIILFFLLPGVLFLENSIRIINTDSKFFEYTIKTSSSEKSGANILSIRDLSKKIKDTIYTDKDCWLELRIDQQYLYQHWRNGIVEKYPISSGNKYLTRSIESRPGLFAIFHKTEHHESSQYNNADMYYFMPFNMGIGFHSLNGTSYYGTLGVRPSSHGCIRMRHNDVRKLFKECPKGTLVLAHNGNTCRVVSFAPADYKNDKEYTPEEYKIMVAENLQNILEGNYYIKDRKYFVIDPKIIPVSGIYIGYDRQIPEKQKYYKILFTMNQVRDKMANRFSHFPVINEDLNSDDSSNVTFTENQKIDEKGANSLLIKKYFHNPIGILPYFPPDKN